MTILALIACAEVEPSPPEGLGFDDADETAWIDGPEGTVRVHYSDRGPNAADQTDLDEDGVPDRAEDVAILAEDALRRYAWEGYAPPVPEAEVGLDGYGGSDALDVFLWEFRGAGETGVTYPLACAGTRCAAAVGVPADEFDDLEMLVDHEVFHAVQFAYDGGEARWLDEGSATWAGGELRDGWLTHLDCGLASIDGDDPCTVVAYSTGLMWDYFASEVDEDVLVRTLEATVEHDDVHALDAALRGAGTSLAEAWPGLAVWNLATGPRAGAGGYPYAALLEGVAATAEGAPILADVRFEPLSMRFFRLDHAGGDLWIGVSGDPGPLTVSVHPVLDGAADGPLAPAIGPVALPAEGLHLGEIAAGGVWIAVTDPDPDGEPLEVALCMGDEADAAACRTACGGCATSSPSAIPLLGLVAWALRRQKPGPPRTSQAAPPPP